MVFMGTRSTWCGKWDFIPHAEMGCVSATHFANTCILGDRLGFLLLQSDQMSA